MFTFWTQKTDGLREKLEVIYVKLEQPSLNTAGGLRQHIAFLKSLPKREPTFTPSFM